MVKAHRERPQSTQGKRRIVRRNDVPALAAIARENGAVSLLDNTWASPLGFPAL